MIAHLATIIALAGCSISGASFAHAGGPDGPNGGSDGDDDQPGTPVDIRLFTGSLETDAGVTANVDLVGFRDGDGAWQALTGNGGVYRAHVLTDRFSVAAGCTSGTTSTIAIYEQMLGDDTTVSISRCLGFVPTIGVSGTVTGIGNDVAFMSSGFSGFQSDPSGAFELRTPPGSTELFATHLVNGVPQAVIRHSGLDIEADTTAAFDFATEGIPVTLASVTTNDSDGQEINAYVNTPTGRYRLQAIEGLPPSPMSYAVVPAALMQRDDFMEVAWIGSGGRTTTKLTSGGPVTLDVMDPVTIASPTFDTTSGVIPVFTLPIQVPGLPIVHYEMGAETSGLPGSTQRVWFVSLTDAWVRTTSTTTYSPPSLDSLPGYDASTYALVPHVSAGAQVARIESSSTAREIGRETRSTLRQFLVSNP